MLVRSKEEWEREASLIEKKHSGVLYYPGPCISGYYIYCAEPGRGDADHINNGMGLGEDAETKVSLAPDYKMLRKEGCSDESIKFFEEHFEGILRVATAEEARLEKNEDGTVDGDSIIFTYTSLYMMFGNEDERSTMMKVYFKIRQRRSDVSDIRIIRTEVEDPFYSKWDKMND